MLEVGQAVDRKAVANHFEVLIKYTQHHFSSEESMLRAAVYAQLNNHAKSHGSFTHFVYDMRNRLTRYIERRTVEEVLEYLKPGLNHHILVKGAAYKSFISQKASIE